MKQQARCYLFVAFVTWQDSVITKPLLQPALTSCEIPFSGLSFPKGSHICVLHKNDTILQLVLKMKIQAQSHRNRAFTGWLFLMCKFVCSICPFS